VRQLAERLAGDGELARRLECKHRRRAHDQRIKPLEVYASEELARSRTCFFGRDRSYHRARRRFVYKTASAQTGAGSSKDSLRAGARPRAEIQAAALAGLG
jgi:putative two-component system protein, hydrogenase maturation factor HypX/HoxX